MPNHSYGPDDACHQCGQDEFTFKHFELAGELECWECATCGRETLCPGPAGRMHFLIYHWRKEEKKWVGTVFCDPEGWPAVAFTYRELISGQAIYPISATDNAGRVTCERCRVRALKDPWPAYLSIGAPVFSFPDVSDV